MTRPGQRAHIEVDPNKWKTLVRKRSDAATRRAAHITAERARDNVLAAGRVDTGAMADGYTVRKMPDKGPMMSRYRVSNKTDHAIFQELGTKGAVAGPGKVLRFKPKGSSVFIFRKSVRGVSPGHFLRNALRALRVKDFAEKK